MTATAVTQPEQRALRRILILFAHPALQKSRVNRRLIEGVETLDGVTLHDLYEAYPDFCIDVAREQELLESHDVVVFHHPLFWYSTPAILKEWQDLVLEHGWAYGSEGTALHGKILLSAVTTGAGESTYRRDGFTLHTVRQLLAPIERTAILCGMQYLAPFIVHGTLEITTDQIASHKEDYHRVLVALRDDRLDLERALATELPFMNQDLDRLIQGGG